MRRRRNITDMCMPVLIGYVLLCIAVPFTHAWRGPHRDCLHADAHARRVGPPSIQDAGGAGTQDHHPCLICLLAKIGRVAPPAAKITFSVLSAAEYPVPCDFTRDRPADPSLVCRPFRGPPAWSMRIS
jgi:hypothetical protein